MAKQMWEVFIEVGELSQQKRFEQSHSYGRRRGPGRRKRGLEIVQVVPTKSYPLATNLTRSKMDTSSTRQ